MDAKLIQQTSQKLILSPQLRQYLKLLQLPALELQQAIETELEENPVLEELDEKPPADLKQEKEGDEEFDYKDSHPPKSDSRELQFEENFERLMELQEIQGETAPYEDARSQDPKDLQKIRDYRESLLSKSEGLTDYLLWQIRFLDFDEKQAKIAEEIIGNLNADGYLNLAAEEIASACRTTPQEVELVLKKIQELDPPGIAARNLQEALLIQLERKDPRPELAIQIVKDFFSLLVKRDWSQIAKHLSLPPDAVKLAAGLIAKLEPRPGGIFYLDEAVSVTPDVSVALEEDSSKLKIEVHREFEPRLRISPYYRRLLRAGNLNAEARRFIRDKITAAMNFMNALKLRGSTLQDITKEIVRMQPEFFTKGFSRLKPMRLKDVAKNLGIHESTVSRAIHSKYISTPQGMIPFKSFFSSRLETKSGEEESQKSMIEKIRRLIETENPAKCLSDQAITNLLTKEGIKIARRTVAKYREMMKILPSHLRKR